MSLHTLATLQDLIPCIGAVMLVVGYAARTGAHPEDSGFFIVCGTLMLMLSVLFHFIAARA